MKKTVAKIKKNNAKSGICDVLEHISDVLATTEKVEIKKPKVKKAEIKKPATAVCPLEDTVDNAEKAFDMKTWYEFRGTGLLLFVNMFLHMFGWAIVVEVDDDLVQAVYPARTKYRGFSEDSIAKAYKKLSAYVAKVGATLKKEAGA